jgi:hypothetical protein
MMISARTRSLPPESGSPARPFIHLSGRGSLSSFKGNAMPAEHAIVGRSQYEQGPWDRAVSAESPRRLTSHVIESEQATSTQIQVI